MLNTAGPLESRLVANTTGFPLSKSLALSPWMECNGNGDVKRWAGISMILSFLLQNNEMFICLPIICLAGKLSRRLLEEGEEASLVGMVNTSSRSSTATQTSVTSDSDRINTSVVLCKRQKTHKRQHGNLQSNHSSLARITLIDFCSKSTMSE